MGKKMRNIFLTVFFLLGAAGFYHAPFVLAADIREFSADMVSHSGGQSMQGKLYVSDKKMRTETQGNVIITRLDKNINWIIMPSEKMYMEQAIDPKVLPKTDKNFEGEESRVSLGRDIVDGKTVEKFKVNYTERGSRVAAYEWLTEQSFPIKIEAVDGSWGIEYRNFSPGQQDDALFEPPADYQKMSMPFGGSGSSAMPSMEDIMKQVGVSQ